MTQAQIKQAIEALKLEITIEQIHLGYAIKEREQETYGSRAWGQRQAQLQTTIAILGCHKWQVADYQWQLSIGGQWA